MKKIITLLFVCSSLFCSSKTIWVYDTDITYIKSENSWEEYLKTTYEYDNNGNLVQQIRYNWDNGWIESLKYTYSYDSNGNQTEMMYRSFKKQVQF